MSKQTNDLLYDSEAALRLVDTALDELREEPGDAIDATRTLEEYVVGGGSQLGLLGLSRILVQGHAEIVRMLKSLRESREALEHATVERLQQTHDKLREVSSATEVAATDILNGLERALALVDRIDAPSDDSVGRGATTTALRDELFGLMSCMQFQDITSQQLNYASSVLVEMEQRLTDIALLFDPAAFGTPVTAEHLHDTTFDPRASTENSVERQAIADAIVAVSARTPR